MVLARAPSRLDHQADPFPIKGSRHFRHGRKILKRGTSAHRQLAVYHKAVAAGAEPQEALNKVVDFLIKETVAGL